MWSTALPSLSSSCGSMASMASMVAEGGGGEQVTTGKAMQMQSAALQRNRRIDIDVDIYNVSRPQRSAACIITKRQQKRIVSGQIRKEERGRDGDIQMGEAAS